MYHAYSAQGDTERSDEWQGLAGWRWRDFVDLGFGVRHSKIYTRLKRGWVWAWSGEKMERNADIYGPMIMAKAADEIGDLPLGWYAGASWMFLDLGPLDDIGFDGSHYDLEAGLSYRYARVSGTVGYRIRAFRDMPDSNVLTRWYDRDKADGIFAAVVYEF